MKSAMVLLLNVDGLGMFENYMSLLNAKTQMEHVNSEFALGLDAADRAEQLLTVNSVSPQHGQTSVPSFFTSGLVSPSSANKFYMDGMRNQALAGIQSLSPYTDLLFAYAQHQKNSRSSTQEITQEEILYSSIVDEPIRTIMLLRKSDKSKIRARGQQLLKKAAARCMHVQTGPKREDCRRANPLPNALMDLVVDGDNRASKNFVLSSVLKDPSSALVLNRLINDLDISSAVNSNIDLTFLNLLGARKSDEKESPLDQIAPNDAYLMFKLIEEHAKSKTYFPPDLLLSLAYGNDVLDIKADSFQETFGVSTSNFICAVHEKSIRLPCLVNQDTVTATECVSQGCCFNQLDEKGARLPKPTKTPKCYKNILGKLGLGIARHMIKKEHIIDLFGGEANLPTLSDLTEASNWAESQMPDVLRRMVKEPGDYAGAPENHKMWDDAFDSKSKTFKIHNIVDDFSGRKDFVWKAHGPTAMPGAANLEIPEVGGFLSGTDPRADKLDFWVSTHANRVRAQLNSNSYTCQLIEPENMSACFPQNYAALNMEDPAAECEAIGCCFNELHLFHEDGPLPVCYRSLRAGFCDISLTERALFEDGTNNALSPGFLEHEFWKNTPERIACGEPGIDRQECLLKHPTCCFDSNPRLEGDSFCYRRGGAESRIDPKTGKSSEGELDECLIIPLHQREGCFNIATKHGKLLNRIATVEQCDAMGCCFDAKAAESNKNMSLFGLNLAGPHCYGGPSNLDRKFTNSNYNQLQRKRPSELQRVCANSPKWPSLNVRKWEENPLTGRYELQDTSTDRPLSRQACLSQSKKVHDRHKCIYELNCCFEKSGDPNEPWCYKSRLVEKSP